MLVEDKPHSNGVCGRVNSIIKVVLLLTMFTFTIPLAEAITISNVNAPESIIEGELLQVSFTATGNNASQFIFRNGILVAQGPNYNWQTMNGDLGTYTFRFLANNTNESEEEIRVVEVLNNLNNININYPPNGVIINPQIRLSVTSTLNATSCNYSIDGVPTGSLSESGNEWIKIILLSTDGVYNISVTCSDGIDGAQDSSVFILDTTPPTINSKSPQGSFGGTPIQLEVTTGENSYCKYSELDVSYDQMNAAFSQTGGTTHKQIITVPTQGNVDKYIACEDSHGNKMLSNEVISFYANLLPSAEVSIIGDNKKEDQLRPGTYEIKVETSEEVINPTLSYEFSKDRTRKSISLEGDGINWQGYIAIDEGTTDDVGTFFFSAKDLTDITGTEITKGKIFLVDAQPPEQIESFKITSLGINADLEWFYEGEPVDNFIIYRSEDPGVSQLDKFYETPQPVFTDDLVLFGKRYYYRIAAEDKAGNIGPLSEEKNILIEMPEEANIDPELVRKLNATQQMLERNVFDIETSLRALQAEEDSTTLEVISHLNLVDEARQAKLTIESLIKEIEKLKLIDLNEDEIKRRTEVFVANADKNLERVVDSITIVDSTRHDQLLFEDDIDEIINEILVGIKLTEDGKEEYKKSIRRLQDRTRISVEGINAKLYFIGKPRPEEFTLIHKKIITDIPIENGIIVEKIDKGVARRDSEIIFKTPPTVLRPDPIVKWEESNLISKDIYYYVKKIADLTSVKNSKTVILKKPSINKIENQITGAVLADPEELQPKLSLFNFAPLILGLIMIVGLLVYYVAYVKEGRNHQRHYIMPSGNFGFQQNLPPKQIIQQKQQVQPQYSKENLVAFSNIKKSHYFVDNMNYEKALETYKTILSYLEKENSSKIKEHLEKETRKIYEKLSLITNINTAHYAVDTKDLGKLKESLLDVKSTYDKLRTETPLAKHARKHYSYLISYLKNADREKFFSNVDSETNI